MLNLLLELISALEMELYLCLKLKRRKKSSMHEAKCIKWRKQDRREESDQGLYSGMVFKWLGRKRVVGVSTKLRLVKAMVFPVIMYGCES